MTTLKPHFLKDNEQAKSWRQSLNMKPSTIKVLGERLRKVVTNGTGNRLSVPSIRPASGKSATAEAGVGRLNHTWFGTYAPAAQSEIAENSDEHRGSLCGAMVLQVLKEYFHKQYRDKVKNLRLRNHKPRRRTQELELGIDTKNRATTGTKSTCTDSVNTKLCSICHFGSEAECRTLMMLPLPANRYKPA
jgi:hypothetical protein